MQAKNEALAAAGAIVPTSFEAFEGTIRDTFARMVAEGAVAPRPDVEAPSVPQDLEAAKKEGKVSSGIRVCRLTGFQQVSGQTMSRPDADAPNPLWRRLAC